MRGGIVATCAVLALAVAGCGGDDSGGAAQTAGQGLTSGAKKAPTLEQSKNAKGTITMCAGKDTSGALTEAIKGFNDKYAAQGVKVKLLELAADATEVRKQFVQRAEAKSPDCDVLQSDIIWIAEFAQQKWLLDLSDYATPRKDEFIPSTLSSYDYDGKLWGLPQVTGAGLLYRRTDQVPDAPASWDQVYSEAAENDGYAYQGAAYEGLTCDFIEMSSAAGGRILSEDGKKAEFDSPENLKALQFMVDGMKDGAVTKATRTYMEEQARQAFEQGKATFMRNWSYAYALGKKAPKVKDHLAVTALPAFDGKKGGVLGGNGPVISAFTKNPEASVLWLDYWTSPEVIKHNAAQYALPPTMPDAYDDPAVKKTLPYAAELRDAVQAATSRPVSPVYSQISEAVYTNVNKALGGQMSPQDALSTGQKQIEQALSTF